MQKIYSWYVKPLIVFFFVYSLGYYFISYFNLDSNFHKFVLYIKGNDKINYADWISAGCNVIMAIAALGGFLIAWNWKRTSVRDKVVSHALELKVSNLNKVKSNLQSLRLYLSDVERIYSHQKRDHASTELIQYLFTDFNKKLDGKVEAYESSFNEFSTNKSMIEALGYKLKDTNGVFFDKIGYGLDSIHSDMVLYQSKLITTYLSDNKEALDYQWFKDEQALKDSLAMIKKIDEVENLMLPLIYSNDSILNYLKYKG